MAAPVRNILDTTLYSAFRHVEQLLWMLLSDFAGIVNTPFVVAVVSFTLKISARNVGPKSRVSYGIVGNVYCHKACSGNKVPWLAYCVVDRAS
jgi:hypothetical protein